MIEVKNTPMHGYRPDPSEFKGEPPRTGSGVPGVPFYFPTGESIVINVNSDVTAEQIKDKLQEAIYNKLYKRKPEISNYDLAIQMLREIAQDSNIGAEWRIEACNILKGECEL
jgi:hypothetical protein